MAQPLYIGCAGWALARSEQPQFPPGGSHLERYAAVFNAVEINSSFYRPHKRETYRRWAASVPEDFRFAAKLPRSITHQSRLVGALPQLEQFLGQVGALEEKLGVLLIQLPPSLAFDVRHVSTFLRAFRTRYYNGLCLEPRHASWFTPRAETLLQEYRVARAAADPAVVPAAALPGGDDSLCYTRLHGSPRMYYSGYDAPDLQATLQQLQAQRSRGAIAWCIFDNTAAGRAVPDALSLRRLAGGAAPVSAPQRPARSDGRDNHVT